MEAIANRTKPPFLLLPLLLKSGENKSVSISGKEINPLLYWRKEFR